MSGRIPQDFIDDLVQRADIVEVVGSRVPLTKAGREYKARCPFHSEKTPSFSVSPQKGFYHCFGCGAHGTALGFLMEFERLDFPVAVEELARSVGVEVPHTDGERAIHRTTARDAGEGGRSFTGKRCADHPAAVDYLKSTRPRWRNRAGTSASAMRPLAGTPCSAPRRQRRLTGTICWRQDS